MAARAPERPPRAEVVISGDVQLMSAASTSSNRGSNRRAQTFIPSGSTLLMRSPSQVDAVVTGDVPDMPTASTSLTETKHVSSTNCISPSRAASRQTPLVGRIPAGMRRHFTGLICIQCHSRSCLISTWRPVADLGTQLGRTTGVVCISADSLRGGSRCA